MHPSSVPTPPSRLASLVRATAARLARWRDALNPPRPAVPYDWFNDAEVAGYDASLPADDPRRIDDATWRDLDADRLLRRLAGDASICARQWLFHRLRRGAPLERGVRPAWMGRDEDADTLLARSARALHGLRCQETEVTGVLFHDQLVRVPSALRQVRWAKLLWMLALASIWTPWGAAGAVLALAYLLVYGTIEVRFHARLAQWKTQRGAVLGLLQAFVRLGEGGGAHPALAEVAAHLDEARRLWRLLDLDASERQVLAEDYMGLLTLHRFATAPARIARLEASLLRLRALYAVLAECEGRLCLLEHLRRQPVWCWAQASTPHALSLVDMGNPLLDASQPVSLTLHGQGVFLTGQNGVGKSTFLRGVGLNLLLARAFGFCHARSAALPVLPVWSSMVHEDSIAIGDSLYMAEMRRAQALLQVAEREEGVVFLVDEIFRGTNHLESVAAATAVLNRLASRGAVIVSSHSMVLAPLLRARLAPLRLVRAGERALALEPGVLCEPNGIDMMARYGLADDVRAEALRVHDWFAGHVATPTTFPTLA